ncbi:MAG: hypothetical protein H6658_02185 [Ardenticatenaceae bacterium]|nr:hypothetical protein [Ardenticatenaceae bacterium]
MNEAIASNEKRVPKWVVDYLDKWRGMLHLQSWKTETSLSPHPADDKWARACVTVYPDVLTAVLTIRDDVPEDITAVSQQEATEWQQTVIHELIHVFMGRITDFIERDIWPELSPGAQRIAEATLRREVEPVVELMAHILHNMEKPDEQEKSDNSGS